jgi:hypothetical protein
MADIYVPDDLRDTSQPDTDKNYFKIVITDLNPGEVYPIQFRWQYEDKTYSDWSASKSFTAASEVALNAPQFLSGDLSADGSALVIKWSGFDSAGNAYPSNLDRVDIYINGGSFGASYVKAADSFKSAGTKVIAVGTGTTYYVKLRAVSKSGVESSFSTERSATTVANLIADVTAPSAPSTGTVTAGIDNSTGATIGFNAFLDISWNAVSDSTLRGYRIRFRENGTSNPFSYVDSPGTGTTFRLNGLSIGTTYSVGVASYDELNNTSSSYTSLGTAVASGTPFIGKNVTTAGYFGASATGDTGTFKFGYGVQDSGGTKRGLVFNSNNYWYIDSGQSALFKLGGDADNYIEWTGAAFTVAGNIIARGGSFSGNVAMTTVGASIYNGTLDGTGALTGTGFILNKDGLQFKVSGTSKITLDASNGSLTATTGQIAGWSLNTTNISKTATYTDPIFGSTTLTTTLGSSGTISLVSSANSLLGFGDQSLLTVSNALSSSSLSPGYLKLSSDTTIFGVPAANISIAASPLDSNSLFRIQWSGGTQANGYSTSKIVWSNYIASNEKLNHYMGGDLAYRPLVVDDQGVQRLGPYNYYGSSSSATMAAATYGQDGDLMFSTNAS